MGVSFVSGPLGLLALVTLAGAVPFSADSASAADDSSKGLWQPVRGNALAPSSDNPRPAVRPNRFRAYTLSRGGMASLLAGAPRERSRAARERPLVLSLPAPGGSFQRFAVQLSPVMEPALAAKHPEIKTYSGRGIDDPAATIRFDLTPLGFHASVRAPQGAWYIDPYYHLDQSLYVTYYGRDVTENPHGSFVERDSEAPELSVDRGYYHAVDTVQIHGSGFTPDTPILITISSPEGRFAARTVDAVADGDGSFVASFVADPDGNLGTHEIEAGDGAASAFGSYDVVSDEDASVDPPVGDQLRTYRLALVTDSAYANFFGGPANVTAAKATLVNRVNQVYEDETSIRLVLVGSNDLLNLDTSALATGANGPCGTAGCFTFGQIATCNSGSLARNRIVIGQIIGASNYDIGHLALGGSGGGVANLGVVGRGTKAQGCTGVTTPVGDLYAVDYVAHELGHQFAGNHPFNGTVSNCFGFNRSAATSVEPGSGSSIMAYAGICGADNLQPHSDPYWSQRSFQEIVTYVGSNRPAINEVQTVSLRSFDTDGDSFRLVYDGNQSVPIVRGDNYTTAGILAAIQGIPGWPTQGGTPVTVTIANFGGGGAPTDNGFQVTFNTAPLAGINVSALGLTDFNGASGFVGETDKGGPVDNKGFTITPTGNSFPIVAAPGPFTIPLRTPFALTGSAVDADGDVVTYMWEQNDRGGTAGTSLMNDNKTNGPLFRQFGAAANVTPAGTLLYDSPGENAVTTSPTRVFPDLAQILANNTNAETGTCPAGNLECFSEFLPTSAYAGFAGVNASPLSLHFRLTARDGHPGAGGVSSADTMLLLATNAGPFLVTSPDAPAVYMGGSTQTITWDVANTSVAPVGAADVKISLSIDGGFTYPYVLAASTPNDGSEPVMLPNVATVQARVKIEAVGNVFFDVSNSDFTIQALPLVTSDAPAGEATVQYSDALSATVTLSASDADSPGSALIASASGLPAGLSLAVGSTSDASTLPGTCTWTIAGNVTARPGTFHVTVSVTDDTGGAGSTTFTIVVNREDAEATYTGDMLAFTPPGGTTAAVVLRATIRDGSGVPPLGDTAPGDVTRATVSFKEGTSTLCGPVPVALVGGDTTTGTASCSVPLWLGAHSITVQVDGDYTGAGTGLVEVATPDGSFVTGGGYRMISASGGAYRADAGSQMNFGLNVKYARNTKNLQGHLSVVFRGGGKTYQIKSTALESLGLALRTAGGAPCPGPPSSTCFGLADFRSKANLADVTDPLSPISVAGNLSLQVTITDRGEPGSNDSIGVTLWSGTTLLFSSEWRGSKTLEQRLDGGNTVVH